MILSKEILQALIEATKDLDPEKRNRFLWRLEEFFGEMGTFGHDMRRMIGDMRRVK